MASSDRIAIITGAGTGIGKASAIALAGRRKDMLEAPAAEAKKAGARTLVVQTDVADPAAIRALFAKAKETFGRLDLLFNNAGIGAPAVPMEDLPFEGLAASEPEEIDPS